MMRILCARLQRLPTLVWCALLMGWYGLATLPALADYPPLIDWAEMGIAAPAYQLAARGVYGNDLFAGFYRTEAHNYEYMPLYPLAVAAAFKLLGLGTWQARLVSAAAGLLIVLLTFRLGRELYGPGVGLTAAGVLGLAHLGPNLYGSGIPLLDQARVIRYDIFVPVWVLSACSCFAGAYAHRSQNGRWGYALAGFFVGLATLSHVYGAFSLSLLLGVLVWERGCRVLRTGPLYLVLAGWVLALAPWALYIAQDLEAYRGQMLRHEARFDLINPAFYWHNLLLEPARYVSWVGGSFRQPALWPRPGLWLAAAGLVTANIGLVRRLLRTPGRADGLLVLSLPLLAGALALFISLKRPAYLMLVLPFVALQVGWSVRVGWQWATQRSGLWRGLLASGLLMATLEGGLGVARNLQAARHVFPYRRVAETLSQTIPPGAQVLLSQPYWLALARYETRSINLAFVLSDPRYFPTGTPTLEQVIRTIDPDYVVVEEAFLESYAQDPTHSPQAVRQWKEFGEYLARHCVRESTAFKRTDYGEVTVYLCQ